MVAAGDCGEVVVVVVGLSRVVLVVCWLELVGVGWRVGCGGLELGGVGWSVVEAACAIGRRRCSVEGKLLEQSPCDCMCEKGQRYSLVSADAELLSCCQKASGCGVELWNFGANWSKLNEIGPNWNIKVSVKWHFYSHGCSNQLKGFAAELSRLKFASWETPEFDP